MGEHMRKFWIEHEELQKVLWHSPEDVLDMVWEAADGRFPPERNGYKVKDLDAAFRLGAQACAHPGGGRAWGLDTGVEYIAVFVGTEQELVARLAACGVVLS